MKRPLRIATTNGASRVVVGLARRRLLLLSFETFVAPLAADRRDPVSLANPIQRELGARLCLGSCCFGAAGRMKLGTAM